MATTVLTTLNSNMFVAELDRLLLATTEKKLAFEILAGSDVVFSTSYYPDSKGHVCLYKLSEIFLAYIPNLCAVFTLKVNGAAIGPGAIRVFRCSMSINTRASEFLQNFFLTPATGTRVTAVGRFETLSLYSSAAEEAYAECTYFSNGSLSKARVSLGSASGQRLLNVSPARFSSAGRQLVEYTVNCGQRSAKFRVRAYSPEVSEAFIFRNAFNAWETLYLTGLKEITPEYERSNSIVDGFFRNYDIRERLNMKTFTGPLPEGMEWTTMGLASSKAVFLLLENGDAGDEIFVYDSDLKHNNDGASASDLTFSYRNAAVLYRLADDRSIRILVPRPPRIFDDTFDQTYE